MHISMPSHFDNYMIACLAILLFQIIISFLKMLCVFEIIKSFKKVAGTQLLKS